MPHLSVFTWDKELPYYVTTWTEMYLITLCVCVCVCVCLCVWCVRAHTRSVMSNSLWPPWTVACQAPLSMRFPRQEYWSGLPFPSLEDHPNSGIKLASLVSPAMASRFSTIVWPGKPAMFNHIKQQLLECFPVT